MIHYINPDERLTISKVREIVDNHMELALSDEALAQKMKAYKQNLKEKIVKANAELAEVKYQFKV